MPLSLGPRAPTTWKRLAFSELYATLWQMPVNHHKHVIGAILGSISLFLAALVVSPILLWLLLGAAQEAGVSPRLLYQNYSELGYAGGYQLSLWLIMATLLYFGAMIVLRAKDRIKTITPWLVAGGLIASLALTITTATIVLYRTTNGLENFQGRNLKVAQNALQRASDRDLGPLHIPWKYRVVDVHEASKDQTCLISQDISDQTKLNHYAATIEGIWLFGIHDQFEQSLCEF